MFGKQTRRFAMLMSMLFLILPAIGAPVVLAATTIYVSTAGNDSSDCLAATSACKTIDGALNKAAAGDTISVAAGTYTENVTLAKNVTISGAGRDQTIVDGNTTDRVFAIGVGITATITHLTARNGATPGVGGGIFDDGTLTLDDVLVRDSTANNTGGGIGVGIFNNNAALTLTNSTVTNNTASTGGGIGGNEFGSSISISHSTITGNTASTGGGIVADGALMIDTSEVSNNHASNVGGLGAYGTFSLNNSTISGNIAENATGGALLGGTSTPLTATVTNSTISSNIAKNTIAGGLNIGQNATVNVVNSTISGNQAPTASGGGILNVGGRVALFNVTVTNNTALMGGGVYNITTAGSSVEMRNSIIAGNSFGPQAGDCGGPITSQDYNLIQTTTGCTLSSATTNNITGQAARAGPLQDNGGATATHALLPDSPAINAGNPSGCVDENGAPLTTDQRGQPRPFGQACDIGAYEFQGLGIAVYVPMVRR